MIRIFAINLLRFLLLVFIQVFLLKNVALYGLSTPYLYILFILLLPFDTPNILLFLLAFLIGITIDSFYDTPGLNAAASVILALVRIIFIDLTVQKDGFDNEPEPTLSIMGFRWFFTYTVILTLIHHFILFSLGSFSIAALSYIISGFLLSSLFTILLILLVGLLFYTRRERK